MSINIEEYWKEFSEIERKIVALTLHCLVVDRYRDSQKYARLLGVKNEQVKKVFSKLSKDGFLVEPSEMTYYTVEIVAPQYFFTAAMYLSQNEGNLLESFSKKGMQRMQQAQCLWQIVAALCDEDYSFKAVDARDIDEILVKFIFGYNEPLKLRGLLLKLDEKIFAFYIKELLNLHLQNDLESNGVYDYANQLIADYCKTQFVSPVLKFELQDFVAMHQYLYDGTPLGPFTVKTVPRIICLGIQALYQGDAETAIVHFFDAMKIQNKQMRGDKNVFVNPLFNYFLVLALLKSDTEQSQKRLKTLLGKSSIAQTLRMRSVYLLGLFGKEIQQDERRNYEIRTELSRATSVLESYLNSQVASFLLANEAPEPVLQRPNFAILRHECNDAYKRASETDEQLLCDRYGGVAVISTLHRVTPWESVLGNIETLLGDTAEGSKANEAAERIVYVLRGGYAVDIKKQVRLKNGSWSGLRQVSMSDFMRCALPFMNEQDKNVCHSVGSAWWYNPDLDDVLSNMVGSDRVFRAEHGTLVPVTIREEVPYLLINLENKRVKITSNTPGDEQTVVNKHSDVEYCVVRATKIQSALIQQILKLNGSPTADTAPHIKRLLPLVATHVEVHSDALEGGSSLEKREGDTAIYVYIDPQNDAYRIMCRVHPLSGGQLVRCPGQGEKELFDESDGVRYHVERSLKTERANLKLLTDFVESICDDEYDETMGYKLQPQDALQVVEWLTTHEDTFVTQWAQGAKLKVKGVASGSNITLKSNGGWFEAEGEVQISDASSIDIHKLLSLIAAGGMMGKYVKLDDSTYLALTEEMRKQMKRLESMAQLGQGKVRVSAFNIGSLAEVVQAQPENFSVNKEYKALLKKIKESATLDPQVPDTLNATLRDYQYEGFRWMVRLDHWGAGACLADDMGLGKTVQTITFLLYKAKLGPSLVIAPTSVVSNWKSELARFAPSLNVVLLNHADDRKQVLQEATAGDVVLTTYGLMPQMEEELAKVDWNVVCLDEAHSIKNRQTKTSSAVMALKANSRLLLTGTPVQNYLGELWNLLQFLNPGLLGSYEAFAKKYITPENPDLTALRRMVQPFILRRTKAEVLDELPEKTEITRLVELSDLEITAYETMRLKIKSELEKEKALSVNALAYITRLRQAACAMALVDKKWKDKSSKLQAFVDLLTEILLGGNRVLVFSQFTSFLALAKQELEAAGIPYFYLDGSTPLRQRDNMVKEFQKGEKGVFVVSLKAGGLGLNLTGANYVIHLDPWWNPAIEQQATDRAHRIGQRQNVTVYRLISAHTIEEKIVRLHKTKRDLADSFLEGTNTARTITLDDLKDFVK